MSFNLHRVADGKTSDWEGTPYAQMNRYQKRAHDTHGIDTPGNRVTLGRLVLGGLSLVAIKKGYKKAGLIGLGISLAGDWVDGKVADATATKMKRNGDFDAVADMALRGAALPVLASSRIITKEYAGTLVALNSAAVLATAANTFLGHDNRSNIAGKAKTVAEGVSLLAAGINSVANSESYGMRTIEQVAKVTAVVGNIVASVGYFGEVVDPSHSAGRPVLPLD